MNESTQNHYLRFPDLALNPYILDLYRSLSTFLPESIWWITGDDYERLPFPQSGQSPFCESSPDDPQKDKCHSQDCLTALRNGHSRASECVVECCQGFLQGFAGIWYRNHFLGGIGICHVASDNRALFESILLIVEGYLHLLGGALEDHDDLELVHRVWSETITIIDLDDLLDRIMNELCLALGLSNGLILLIDEDGDFYPAHMKDFPEEVFKRSNLEINRYEYIERYDRADKAMHELPEDDPIRQWFEKELSGQNDGDRSYLAVSFYRNTYLIGMFISCADCFYPYSDTKQSLIRLLAAGGAAALDNALTVQRMEKRERALSTIHVVHRLISSPITSEELLPRIGQLTRQLLQVETCSIMLRDHQSDRLIPHVMLGLKDDEVGQQTLEFGEGLPGWVAENFNPIFYRPGGDAAPPWKSVGETYPARSYLAVALFDSDIEGVITVSNKDGDFIPGDREILLTFAEQVVLAVKNTRLHEGERTVTLNALKSIANLIETQDPVKPGVTVKTCEWAKRLSCVMDLSHEETLNVTYASLLHDTGMFRSFQSKSPYEEQRLKGPELSLRFVQSLGLPREVGDIVYHVNEAWNGQGFPDGLKGEQIPLGSRIIAVANAFATLLSRWSEREEHLEESIKKAFQILSRLEERSYDPAVVNALRQAIDCPPEKD